MQDITQDFCNIYYPKSALVFYETNGRRSSGYVEYFEIDRNGSPINAHPLTTGEGIRLAKALKVNKKEQEISLKPKGVLGSNILTYDSMKGTAIWFTKAQQRHLYFTKTLDIPDGPASIPAMVWMASRSELSVFALPSDRKPTEKTVLYNAPFFNIGSSGQVCMGSVDIDVKKAATLEAFIQTWEYYFFHSRFSHLMEQHNPVICNCVLLWQELIGSPKPFPNNVLQKTTLTLKDLL